MTSNIRAKMVLLYDENKKNFISKRVKQDFPWRKTLDLKNACIDVLELRDTGSAKPDLPYPTDIDLTGEMKSKSAGALGWQAIAK